MLQYPFRNLIFEGGGIKGLAYIGVLDVLYSKESILPNIKRVGGTSAGAIVALLVGLNYSLDEIIEELSNLDMKEFTDDDWGIIFDTSRFLIKYGWHKGDKIQKWIEERIKYKTGNPHATFADIKKSGQFKDLYIIGTNVNSHFSEIFSHENTPDMSVARAVRISMSIPLFFEAVSYNGDIYTDGGLLMNYPVKLFDRESYLMNKENKSRPEYYVNRETIESKNNPIESKNNPLVYNMESLGFRVDSKIQKDILNRVEIQKHQVSNIYEFVKNIVGAVLDIQQNTSYHDDDSDRTIYIDSLDVSAIDFNINKERKKKLIESGKTCTEEYFQAYNNMEIPRKNRPIK